MSKAVDMIKGRETITITMTEESGKFVVASVKIYWTSQGGRVGGTSERSFHNEDKARQYANGWFFDLKAKGWRKQK